MSDAQVWQVRLTKAVIPYEGDIFSAAFLYCDLILPFTPWEGLEIEEGEIAERIEFLTWDNDEEIFEASVEARELEPLDEWESVIGDLVDGGWRVFQSDEEDVDYCTLDPKLQLYDDGK